MRRPLTERFWEKVRKTRGCWLWTAAKTDFGYGTIGGGGRGAPMQLAHRLSWAWANGPIPAGLCVLHRCDNPPCVNPDHLFLGTLRDNFDDMVAKGRARMGQGRRPLTATKAILRITAATRRAWRLARKSRNGTSNSVHDDVANITPRTFKQGPG